MMLTTEVKTCINKSVLCWLATVDGDGQPNVSPKEMFMHYNDNTLLIAHIASPVTLANITRQPKVCVSFVDVFVQKGYKIKGLTKILKKNDPSFLQKSQLLKERFTDRFLISAVIQITVTSLEPIQAPSYLFFPETATETDQIESAMETYGVMERRDIH